MDNPYREAFEKWLRTVRFQKPTPEAYGLAWRAWKAAQKSVRADETNVCPDCVPRENDLYAINQDDLSKELVRRGYIVTLTSRR